jgi:regulatory protein
MPVITKITAQKKLKDRYNIFTDAGDGEKYAFSVDEDVLIKHQLKKGMELDDFALTEILFQDDIRKAYGQAVQYLATRMRSEFEVRQQLKKKEVAEPIVNEVIHKLYYHQFLNDQEFSLSFVRTQMNTTDKGTNVIKQELKEKGINDSLIENALLEYPFEMQLEKAIILSNKYLQKNTRDSGKIAKQKTEQMLVRKGYSFDIIKEANSHIGGSKDENEEMEALRKQGEKLVQKYKLYSGYEFSQKIKQTLYRKGFSIDQIDQFLSEVENQE